MLRILPFLFVALAAVAQPVTITLNPSQTSVALAAQSSVVLAVEGAFLDGQEVKVAVSNASPRTILIRPDGNPLWEAGRAEQAMRLLPGQTQHLSVRWNVRRARNYFRLQALGGPKW